MHSVLRITSNQPLPHRDRLQRLHRMEIVHLHHGPGLHLGYWRDSYRVSGIFLLLELRCECKKRQGGDNCKVLRRHPLAKPTNSV